jgi:ADP-ribose pyrophosphatase YjhB (NUDIX family)
MDLRLNANAIVTNSKGEFLLIELKKGPFKGKFCIPGGGINPGELSEEAVKREVFEETGIVLKNKIEHFGFCELFSKKIEQHRVVLLFHSLSDDIPKESEEGTSRWMTYEEAEKNLNKFSIESIKIWREKKDHFIVDYDYGDLS